MRMLLLVRDRKSGPRGACAVAGGYRGVVPLGLSVGAALRPATRSRPADYRASPRPRRSSRRIMAKPAYGTADLRRWPTGRELVFIAGRPWLATRRRAAAGGPRSPS